MRNWVRLGHIKPIAVKPFMFSDASVSALINAVNSGQFSRLQSRANKTKSNMRTAPAKNWNRSSHFSESVSKLMHVMEDNDLTIEPVIFYAAVNLLADYKEITCSDSSLAVCPYKQITQWRRGCVQTFMSEWHEALKHAHALERYLCILPLIEPGCDSDYLGHLYQSLLTVGNKSERGSYYTPQFLIDQAFAEMKGDVRTFLDPCCGSGQFLVSAAKHFSLHPEHIFGFDSDRLAVQTAKVHLMLAFPDDDFSPHIYCMDALAGLPAGSAHHLVGAVDLIATNPPWGAGKTCRNKHSFSARIASGETFSLFVEKSLELLRRGGTLSVFLPESMLNIKKHADIRKLILEEASVRRITKLGRPFPGVFSEVIRLDMTKGVCAEDHAIMTADHIRTYDIEQQRFMHNAHYIFDISMSRDDEAVIRKIYAAEHDTLKGHALWALGIVTGDNKRFVRNAPHEGFEPVYKGKDIYPYALGNPASFITYIPASFQQAAPEALYRAEEKLIYRFISGTLIAAYDDRQRLPLNSANIVIPRLPRMCMKAALAYLNSRVFQFLHAKKFSTYKVLRGNLESLPFPVLHAHSYQVICSLAERAIREKKTSPELEAAIYRSFGLDDRDISIIDRSIPGALEGGYSRTGSADPPLPAD